MPENSSSKKKKKQEAVKPPKKRKLIPRPPGQLGREKNGGYNLPTAMNLGRKGTPKMIYNRIAQDVRQLANIHLNTKKSFRKQSPDAVTAVCKLMEKRHPDLACYDSTWPVRDLLTQYLNNHKGRIKDWRKNRQAPAEDDTRWDPYGASVDVDLEDESDDDLRHSEPDGTGPEDDAMDIDPTELWQGNQYNHLDDSATRSGEGKAGGAKKHATGMGKDLKKASASGTASKTASGSGNNDCIQSLGQAKQKAAANPEASREATQVKGLTIRLPPTAGMTFNRNRKRMIVLSDMSEDEEEDEEEAELIKPWTAGWQDGVEEDFRLQDATLNLPDVASPGPSGSTQGRSRMDIALPSPLRGPTPSPLPLKGKGKQRAQPVRTPTPVRSDDDGSSIGSVLQEIREDDIDEEKSRNPNPTMCPETGCRDLIPETPSGKLALLLRTRAHALINNQADQQRMRELHYAICQEVKAALLVDVAQASGWPMTFKPATLSSAVETLQTRIAEIARNPEELSVMWRVQGLKTPLSTIAAIWQKGSGRDSALALGTAIVAARVGFFGEQGEAVILSVLERILPEWELKTVADAYYPLPEYAFRHLILAPEVAVMLISAMRKIPRLEAVEVMLQSSNYGYSRFTLDNSTPTNMVIAENHRLYRQLEKQHDAETVKGLVDVQPAPLVALSAQSGARITRSAVRQAAAASSSGITADAAPVPATNTPAASTAGARGAPMKTTKPHPRPVKKDKAAEGKKAETAKPAGGPRILSLTDFPPPSAPKGRARTLRR